MNNEELERLYKAANAKNKKKGNKKFRDIIRKMNPQFLTGNAEEVKNLREKFGRYSDFEALEADLDFRKELDQKLTASSSKDKTWEEKLNEQYRHGEETIQAFYPYAEAALLKIYYFCLEEIQKNQDEKKAQNLLNLFTGIQKTFSLDNNDINSAEELQAQCNTLKTKWLEPLNLQQDDQQGILHTFQLRALQLNREKFNQEALKDFPDILENFKILTYDHSFIMGIKRDSDQRYRENPENFPRLSMNSKFYFHTDAQLLDFYSEALAQAVTPEGESSDFKIKVGVEEAFLRERPKTMQRQSSYAKFTLKEAAEADRIVLSVKKESTKASDFSDAFDQGTHAFLVLNLQGEEGQIAVSGLEVKGLKRFEIAQQVFQNPLAVLFSDFENFVKIKEYSNSLKNAKVSAAVPQEQAKLLAKDPEFNSFPEAQAYASFISSALSRITNLTIEQFIENLQARIEKILQKQSWNAAGDLSELKKCVKMTFMILTGRPEILDEELKTADRDTLLYLLKFSHDCFNKKNNEKEDNKKEDNKKKDNKSWLLFITEFFCEEEQNNKAKQVSQRKANMIVQKILMQHNELFDLMSIIQKYFLEAESKKQALSSLLILIKNILLEGIMKSNGGKPEDLYKNLLESKDPLLTGILNLQSYPYPQERFVSGVWAVREQISADFMQQKIREMGQVLIKKIEEFNEKTCPDKKQCLALLRQAFPVQELSNRAEAGFNVTTAFKNLSIAVPSSTLSSSYPS